MQFKDNHDFSCFFVCSIFLLRNIHCILSGGVAVILAQPPWLWVWVRCSDKGVMDAATQVGAW